jgi:glycosyltransferase involved in cell wall biosynthesis
MVSTPFISICIPAYKNVNYLKRCLFSINEQTYKNAEVVISDDSNDDSVKKFLDSFNLSFPLIYIRNKKSLGSPANWNNAIKHAKGNWIKMMHDDDWFATPQALSIFANATTKTNADIIFSGFTNVNIGKKDNATFIINNYQKQLIKKNAVNLLKKNFIGHPSTTLVKNKTPFYYDEHLKWVVDIEFYIRVLNIKPSNFYCIKQSLLNIGIGDDQITKQAFRNPATEIPENIYLLNTIKVKALKQIWAYDYYWRFIRNINIRSVEKLAAYNTYPVPFILNKMIQQQCLLPAGLLKTGIFCKLTMFISYIYNRLKKRFQ